MFLRRLVPVVLAGALLTAACGGGGDKSDKASTTSTVPLSASGVDGEFCTKVRAYNARFGTLFAAFLASPGGAAGRAALRDRLQELRAEGPDLEGSAPAEIREDAKLVRTTVDNLYLALQRVDFDITKVDRSALAIRTDRRIQQAVTNLGRYVTGTCQVRAATDTTTTTTAAGDTLPGEEGEGGANQ